MVQPFLGIGGKDGGLEVLGLEPELWKRGGIDHHSPVLFCHLLSEVKANVLEADSCGEKWVGKPRAWSSA